ncbi:MAG: hypothetical protein ACXABY_25375 [Candidatus Thorarchaeota archaeon]|jgi:hypothetical protein
MRTSKQDIDNALNRWGYSHRLWIEYAYGQPRVYLRDENGSMVRDVSPRLRRGLVLQWLTAYYKGLCMGLMQGEDS